MEWFWASRWVCSVSKCRCVGNCWHPGLSRETTERWQLNVDVPEMCGGKNLLFLSRSICSDVLLLHLFLKSRLISCSATWPFFSTPQSKHALSYWKQILILILFQHSPCSAQYSLTLFLPCLTFHRKPTFFFLKTKEIGLSLVSVLY